MPDAVVTPARIAATYEVIEPHIRRTPTLELRGADVGIDASVVLKLELHQHAGSFKTRGAFANLLLRDVPRAGVVAASGGNHGAAVAYTAAQRRVPAAIFVPTVSSPAKIERIRSYGADLTIVGARYADALAASEEHRRRLDAMAVHAFDQDETLLGQGTLGLELEQQVGALDTLLVAVGGGGLIGGVAAWFAGRVNVVGVEPESAPTLTRALEAGKPVDAPAGGIAADSLAPSRVGERVYPLAARFVRQVVLVKDDDIARSQETLWRVARIVAEPGGAAAFSALQSGSYRPRAGERVGVVVSGGNSLAVDFGRRTPSA